MLCLRRFKTRALEIINRHGSIGTSSADHQPQPLFLCYTSHIVHEPLQVPTKAFDEFGMIASSKVRDYVAADATGASGVPHRQTYQAMVYYMDGVVGEMRKALEDSGLWPTTLWFHQSDNGGPSFAGPVQSKIRVLLFAARTLNATGQCRVTLSLR